MDIVEETKKLVAAFQTQHPGKRLALTEEGKMELVPEITVADLRQTIRHILAMYTARNDAVITELEVDQWVQMVKKQPK